MVGDRRSVELDAPCQFADCVIEGPGTIEILGVADRQVASTYQRLLELRGG